MRRVRPFTDEGLNGFCFSCGGLAVTRDHVPAKVFLDKPYPENLPVVGACRSCNESVSAHEEYLACLLEVVACGATTDVERPKIRRILEQRPTLAARLDQALTPDGRVTMEYERVRTVVAKLGRGLWSYEGGEPSGTLDTEVRLYPIGAPRRDHLDKFPVMPTSTLFPEVGSRLMIKTIEGLSEGIGQNPWQTVQTGRFVYAVDIDNKLGSTVKMIIRDTLAAEVRLAAPGGASAIERLTTTGSHRHQARPGR